MFGCGEAWIGSNSDKSNSDQLFIFKDNMSTNFIDRVKSKYANIIIDSHNFRGDQTITVKKESALELFKFLRDDPELDFKFLMDRTAVDYLNRKETRFEMVYHFYSLKHNGRLRI